MRLLCNQAAITALRSGESLDTLERTSQADLAAFLERRKAFLLY